MTSEVVERLAALAGGERLGVIVTLESSRDFAWVQEKGIAIDLKFDLTPGFSARLTAAEIQGLAEMKQVRLIELDSETHASR